MEKIRKWIKTSIVMFLVFIAVFSAEQVFGEETEESGGATGFTYKINFPENQMESDLGYFKLKMTSGQEQTVRLTLSNPGSEKVKVNVALNGAKTNQNGVIDYGKSDIENDASLKFDFEDVVSGPDAVELAPGETKDLEIEIKMPKTSINGAIAGGIQLMRDGQGTDDASEGGSRIINQYAYVIGILLQDVDTLPDADLELNGVYAGQSNYRNVIFVDYSNVMPAYLNDMAAEVQITARNNEAVLYERKQTAMRMAPNTFINFPVSMNGERMVAGEYTAKILVTSGERRWEWTEDFEITSADADKFNERDVGLIQEKGLDWKLIVLIVVFILLAIVLIFVLLLIVRKNKEKKAKPVKRTEKKRGEKTKREN